MSKMKGAIYKINFFEDYGDLFQYSRCAFTIKFLVFLFFTKIFVLSTYMLLSSTELL